MPFTFTAILCSNLAQSITSHFRSSIVLEEHLQGYSSVAPQPQKIVRQTPVMRKRNTVRETITYPNVKVTPETDPCRDKSLQHEHVLDCGHLIITPKPDEPCAPNCHHIATSRNPRRKHRKRPEILRFYCDACVETANEAKLSPHLSSAEAGKQSRPSHVLLQKHWLTSSTQRAFVHYTVTRKPRGKGRTKTSDRATSAKRSHPYRVTRMAML